MSALIPDPEEANKPSVAPPLSPEATVPQPHPLKDTLSAPKPDPSELSFAEKRKIFEKGNEPPAPTAKSAGSLDAAAVVPAGTVKDRIQFFEGLNNTPEKPKPKMDSERKSSPSLDSDAAPTLSIPTAPMNDNKPATLSVDTGPEAAAKKTQLTFNEPAPEPTKLKIATPEPETKKKEEAEPAPAKTNESDPLSVDPDMWRRIMQMLFSAITELAKGIKSGLTSLVKSIKSALTSENPSQTPVGNQIKAEQDSKVPANDGVTKPTVAAASMAAQADKLDSPKASPSQVAELTAVDANLKKQAQSPTPGGPAKTLKPAFDVDKKAKQHEFAEELARKVAEREAMREKRKVEESKSAEAEAHKPIDTAPKLH